MPKTNVITIRAAGERYDVDLYDLDGLEWREIKRATGMSNQKLVEAALIDRDFEAMAALVWIWRKRDEPSLTFEDVLQPMNYRPVDDQEDDPNPPG